MQTWLALFRMHRLLGFRVGAVVAELITAGSPEALRLCVYPCHHESATGSDESCEHD